MTSDIRRILARLPYDEKLRQGAELFESAFGSPSSARRNFSATSLPKLPLQRGVWCPLARFWNMRFPEMPMPCSRPWHRKKAPNASAVREYWLPLKKELEALRHGRE